MTALKALLTQQAITAFNANYIKSLLFGSGEAGVLYVPVPQFDGQTVLFQDSAGTVPVTADGDPVGYMQDLSGNGNHATQSTAAAKPLYRTDGTLHWLEFDGVDDNAGSTFAITLPYTRVAGVNLVNLGVDSYIFTGNTTSSTLYRRQGTLANQLTMFNSANGPEAVSSANKLVTSEEYLAGADALYFDGDLVSSASAGDDNGTGLYIGGSQSAGNSAQILFFGVVQSADMGMERERTENYIATLAGVTL